MKSMRAAAILLMATFLAGCGNYYSAELQGFIVDGRNEIGINGATIRFYRNEPSAPDDERFFARTSTFTSNGQTGYFRNAVVWNSWFGSFGPEGDSGAVFLGITHEDYTDTIVEIPGVLSDHVNTIESVSLDRVSFETPLVKGRVVDVNGDGVNGVRVVLDLESTGAQAQDYVAVTGEEPEGAGYYRFTSVSWRDDANAGSESDDENVSILVDDAEWESASTLQLVLTSGQERAVATDIPVTRQPRTEFAATLSGSVVHLVGETELPRPGIRIRVTMQGTGEITTTQTGPDGLFSVRLEWSDTSPRDYDGDGDIGDGADDPTIPEGEDGVLIDIAYDVDMDGYDDGPVVPLVSFELKSWFLPNYVPDWDPGF